MDGGLWRGCGNSRRHRMVGLHGRPGVVGRFYWLPLGGCSHRDLTCQFAGRGDHDLRLREKEPGSAFHRNPAATGSETGSARVTMKHAPARSAILTAERRLAQSRRDTVESFCRLRSALRSRLAQPSSLALAAGLGALIGFWLVRRRDPRTTRAGNGTSKSMAGLAMAFLIRFGWQRLSSLLGDSWATRQPYPATDAPLPDGRLNNNPCPPQSPGPGPMHRDGVRLLTPGETVQASA